MNRKIFTLLSDSEFSLKTVKELTDLLNRKQTFDFPVKASGLFSAAQLQHESYQYTGYGNIWVRDNVFIAYAHYVCGEMDKAVHNARSLANYFHRHRWRFEKIIAGELDCQNPMNRPHIRFEADNLSEIDQPWAHAQNDALGYFLWFFCRLVNDQLLSPNSAEISLLGLFPEYFNAIEYWRDEDSGHWEEERKIGASSIGTVVAGLKELKRCVANRRFESSTDFPHQHSVKLLQALIEKGGAELNIILPAECVQTGNARRYDAALLFLIYPLQLVTGDLADSIIADVIKNLKGDIGIRRYPGDSFWCRDYKIIPQTVRTSHIGGRQQWFKDNNRELIPGEEAQWCIFDPIISTIYGQKYQKQGKRSDLELQTLHLIRSLGQITGEDSVMGEFKCPELYYLEKDRYVANDSTPLLWTQANLRVALKSMEHSLLQDTHDSNA